MIEMVEWVDDVATLENIGKKVRYERIQRHWPKHKLAEKAQISQACLVSLENGCRVPNMSTVIQVLDALGFELAIREKRE